MFVEGLGPVTREADATIDDVRDKTLHERDEASGEPPDDQRSAPAEPLSEATRLDGGVSSGAGTGAPAEGEAFTPTPLREGEARDDSALLGPAEWLVLVVRRREDGAFLLVRRPDAAAPALLSTAPPHADEGLEDGLASVVRTHLGVTVEGAPRVAATARPARMGHPYTGGPAMGLLRAVALEVTGTPEASALFEGCDALPATEVEAALATDLERALFRDGVALIA